MLPTHTAAKTATKGLKMSKPPCPNCASKFVFVEDMGSGPDRSEMWVCLDCQERFFEDDE